MNYADPTGMWRWWLTGSRYHLLIEIWYEDIPFLDPNKQIEYPIPDTPYRHPDMFNSTAYDWTKTSKISSDQEGGFLVSRLLAQPMWCPGGKQRKQRVDSFWSDWEVL
jgi:hypothetical protein